LGEEKFMLVASGALSRIHLRTLMPYAEGLDMSFTNRTDSWAGFSVAGPKSTQIVQNALGEVEAPKFFGCKEVTIGGVDCVILRLSYVGEVSYEIHCAIDDQVALHDALLAAAEAEQIDFHPFGSRAMNAMRIEKLLPRTGDELTIEFTPFELGMDWMLDLERNDDFIGRDALLEWKYKPLRYKMVSFIIDDHDVDALGGEPITTADGTLVGYASSASHGFRVGKTLAVGFLQPEHCNDGEELLIRVLGTPVKATVSLSPVFDPEGKLARA
jgi:dimethylglycine dehydrogenase